MRKLIYLFVLTIIGGCSSSQNQTPDARFKDTHWVLREADGKSYRVKDNEREISIGFFGENYLKGFGGCNQISGGYEMTGKNITFTAATTRMYCEGKMEMENALMNALRESNKYDIEGNFLYLYKDSKELAKFEAVYLK